MSEILVEVPRDVEALHHQYHKLIRQCIARYLASAHVAASATEIDDLQQQVYVHILHTHFLEKCRRFYATGAGYHFTGSLRTMIANHLWNLLAVQRQRARLFGDRSVLRVEELLESPEEGGDHRKWVPYRYDDPSPRQLEALDYLGYLRRRLQRRAPTKRRVAIGRVIEAILHFGTLDSCIISSATGYNASTIRSYLFALRREVRAVESACPSPCPSPLAATKSAPPSLTPTAPASKSVSGARLVASPRRKPAAGILSSASVS